MATATNDLLQAAALPKGSDEFVEAFAKGLLVIAAFADARKPLALTDLAQGTGLTRAGVRRLVLTLQTLGFAEQEDGRFRLTPKTLRLGYAYLSGLTLREVAQPVIDTLARDADETVGLSVLDGGDIVFVARAEVRGLLTRSVTVGSRLPALATSMGRVLAAGLPGPELERFVDQHPVLGYTRHTLTTPPRLKKALAQVAKDGFSVVTEELELGVCGIAAPIWDRAGKVIAAVNMSTNLARHSETQFVKRFSKPLMVAAAEVSERLASQAGH